MLSIEKQILYILTRIARIEVQELVKIYKARGYSSQYIRNTLSQLKKGGYVSSPARSSYSITEQGRSFVQSINRKPSQYQTTWDKTWYIVMVEIPEGDRKKRDQFRNDLLQQGFGPLYKGVYISPWDYSRRIIELAKHYQIQKHVTLVKGVLLHNEVTPEKAAEIWHLDQIKQIYVEKWNYFKKQFLPDIEQKLMNVPDPLDIFLHFLQLGEIITELSLRDPMLPKELLPNNWIGDKTISELWNYNTYLTSLIPPNSYYYQFTS
ncbi:PaaX family transcriptional regulator C-terminal domain-containing protein [Aneurinibacillus terranovensis]|uniref:PaaX family transcriptional regulator C-terminal domain-containing protein n=1 Tax=Aneurinibacillus terranovensis TaxID=278991 RepID=UPI0004252175|nr:PaaX family transcriptional regulator C-terminal domain-containing protein [Aneurinibacillus terranovensis]